MARSILIVDDDPAIRTSLSDALADGGTDVRSAADAEQGLALIAQRVPEVILADVRMPGMDGIGLLRLVRERAPGVDVVLMSAYDDLPSVATAMRDGAADFLVKPLDLHQLRTLLARVFADRATRAAKPPAREPEAYRLDQLVGHDPRMIEIYKRIGQVAANRTTVVVRGESGTGKELIARAVHYNSPDKGEPFVAVNCTALPSTLLESELFGHTRGAFTGAVGERRGRFELAGRGTIFLDEIGDTSLELQSKLLRVLQEREYYPVGAERPERTEARVIAATHRNLEEMVAEGTFREDLYYRLRVVEIVVPPLRERMSDVPLLVQHLVHGASRALGRPPPVLAPETVEALLAHSWPGNVRELENCLTRAVVLAAGDVVRPEHLAIGARPAEAPGRLASLAAMERDHVARVLAATGGHKARAAQMLGVSRPRLDRLIRKFGLG
jgi:DNA-binding NtrC family response regulator